MMLRGEIEADVAYKTCDCYKNVLSYYGRVVKALDLRSNGQKSSWVRTPVVAQYFLPEM